MSPAWFSRRACVYVPVRCFLFPVSRPAILDSSFEERYLELITSPVKSKNLSHAKASNEQTFVCSLVRLIARVTNGDATVYYANTLSRI